MPAVTIRRDGRGHLARTPALHRRLTRYVFPGRPLLKSMCKRTRNLILQSRALQQIRTRLRDPLLSSRLLTGALFWRLGKTIRLDHARRWKKLCRNYWCPIYTYIRRRGKSTLFAALQLFLSGERKFLTCAQAALELGSGRRRQRGGDGVPFPRRLLHGQVCGGGRRAALEETLQRWQRSLRSQSLGTASVLLWPRQSLISDQSQTGWRTTSARRGLPGSESLSERRTHRLLASRPGEPTCARPRRAGPSTTNHAPQAWRKATGPFTLRQCRSSLNVNLARPAAAGRGQIPVTAANDLASLSAGRRQ